MTSRTLIRPLLLALFLPVLAGCGRTGDLQAPTAGGATTASDAAQIATALAANPDYVNEDVWQNADPLTLDTGAGLAAIRPLRFWREIRNVQTDVQTEFLNPDDQGRPTLAIATVRRQLRGSFHIVAGSPDDPTLEPTPVSKPLDDLWTRHIAFVRLPLPDGTLSRWRLAGTSGVEVHTRAGQTRITSLRIQAGDLDTTITDPLELHRLRRILLLPPDTEVRLTASTVATDDVVLFHGRDLRLRFVSNGDGTHSFRFPSGRFPGLRHFGVDALSNGTLFDDAAPYDANAWVLAFSVAPQQLPLNP
jgi:predicted small lipoprotein YifL